MPLLCRYTNTHEYTHTLDILYIKKRIFHKYRLLVFYPISFCFCFLVIKLYILKQCNNVNKIEIDSKITLKPSVANETQTYKTYK